ncbi:MAG TPA: ROK family protein [Firmicutes bacterium]|nr:ROK family protein [Bacillota bacterium]
MAERVFAVGVDLGGTKVATGITDTRGRVLYRVERPTEAEKGVERVFDNIHTTVREVIDRAGASLDQIVGIGVCSPGPLDPATGVVLFAPNLKWNNVPLKKTMEEALGLPVSVENDARLAALGEFYSGAGRGAENMVYITVSTGIGGGLIFDGRLYRGTSYVAGEVGHTIIEPGGPRCGCGNRGCLEALASGTAIARMARELVAAGHGKRILALAGGDESLITAKLVARSAGEGDEEALSILDRAFTYLGIGVANLVNLLNPEVIVIGGGVARIGDKLFEKVRQVVSQTAISAASGAVRIVPSLLGGDAGVVGAAVLALGPAYVDSH